MKIIADFGELLLNQKLESPPFSGPQTIKYVSNYLV